MDVELVNSVWGLIERRAEKAEGAGELAELVNIDEFNPVFDPAPMVFFGRRGAGKTHTLLHLMHKVRASGDVAVYIDMRKLSSNASVYDNPDMAFSTRATNLLVDLVGEVHSELYRLAVIDQDSKLHENLDRIGPALDTLGDTVTQVRVAGETTQTDTSTATRSRTASTGIRAQVLPAQLQLRAEDKESMSQLDSAARSVTGRESIYIHLGTADAAVRAVVDCLDGRRLWILIDEWSGGVPYDLQPILADLLRRIFVNQPRVVLKIAALEHRSNFVLHGRGVEYVGLELGADTAETLSLDSKLVIGTDVEPARVFMRHLLTEHFRAAAESLLSTAPVGDPLTRMPIPLDPIALSFKAGAFDLLVLAAEGNPRDAINLVSKAARKSRAREIATTDVLRAADDYFWNTKYKNIESTAALEKLFTEFMNNSQERGQRTVLVERSDPRRALVDKLYDCRLIHLIRVGVRPGAGAGVYDVYAVDFGSYAERILDRRMTWSNDGFANPVRFQMSQDSEDWRAAVVRRRGSKKRGRRKQR